MPASSLTSAEISTQPECWQRAAELAPEQSATPARPRRAGRGRRLRHVVVHGAVRTPRCASRPVTARPTPSPPPNSPFGRRYDRVRRHHPVRHHHRSAAGLRPASRFGTGDRPHRRPAHPGDERGGRNRRAGLRRRTVRGADPVRHHRARPAARPPRRGPHRRGPRRPNGTRRRPLPRGPGRGAVHLPRHRVDQRPGAGGRPQDARGGGRLDRGLPGDGIPPRPDQHHRPRPRRLVVRPAARRFGREHRRGRRPPGKPSLADPLAELVRAQRLAVAVAEGKGYDPDRPRHLTRSVVLS